MDWKKEEIRDVLLKLRAQVSTASLNSLYFIKLIDDALEKL